MKIWDLDKYRKWLERNKIFFETFAAIFLTIMAIEVSWEANQIASYQAKIMKVEQSPVLHFEVNQIYDPATSNYTRDELVISNVGTPLSEFKSDFAIFFKIESGKKGELPKTALIPLEGYYFHTVITNKPVGELARIANYATPEGNNYKAGQIMRNFSRNAEERNIWGFIDIVRYVRVKYKDIFGDFHIEYYYVSPLNNHRLSEGEGIKIFKDYWESQKKLQNIDFFSNISFDMLYEKWSMRVNESED